MNDGFAFIITFCLLGGWLISLVGNDDYYTCGPRYEPRYWVNRFVDTHFIRPILIAIVMLSSIAAVTVIFA